jgi:hypothetical protein
VDCAREYAGINIAPLTDMARSSEQPGLGVNWWRVSMITAVEDRRNCHAHAAHGPTY